MRRQQERRVNPTLLSDRTYIQLGAAMAVLTFAGGCVWWGAVQSTKLDAVLVDVRAMRDEKSLLVARVDKVENSVGSMMALKEMRDGQIKAISERLDHLEAHKP